MSEPNEVHFQDYAFDKELDRSFEAEGNRRSKRHKRGVISELESVFSFDGRRAGSKGPLGFQIKNTRTEERELPEWARTNEGIQKVLLSAFPRLKTCANQRKRAGRWAQVIQMYFRMGWTFDEVAHEMEEKPRTVEMIIRSITRVSRGERADGSGPRKRNMP